jgi:hypothetical protein
MTRNGYHGTGTAAVAHIGFCLTDDEVAAAHYAQLNGTEPTVYAVSTDTTDLDVVEVEYDYDGCEPVLTGITADIATYTDCDEQGRTHRTWMLLTPAAVAATTIGQGTPADEI